MPHFAFENNKVSSVKLSHLIQPIIFRHIFCGSCETFTTSTFDSSSQISKREPLIMAPLPFYHIYPQWLHLKLLLILPDASPKKDTDIARSSASIFFRSVLPQVGQRGALAVRSARIFSYSAFWASHFLCTRSSASLFLSFSFSSLSWYFVLLNSGLSLTSFWKMSSAIGSISQRNFPRISFSKWFELLSSCPQNGQTVFICSPSTYPHTGH